MSKDVFVNGIHSVAPQAVFGNGFFDDELNTEPRKYLQIIAPKYTDYIPGKQLRRKTKLIRLGLVGAQRVIQDAEVDKIDAIIVGPGNGNISDTEKFLNAIIDNGERMLVPTSFVQSTPNAIPGSIAIMLKNTSYNMAYTHANTAFEMSLLDALLGIREGDFKNVMLGALDEITEENYQIRLSSQLWSEEEINPLQLFDKEREKALIGESSSFFILSDSKSKNTYARLLDVEIFRSEGEAQSISHIESFLSRNQLENDAIDLLMSGMNSVKDYDNAQRKIIEKCFPRTPVAFYKHIVGEHPTSSAFAFWMAAQILSGKSIPEIVMGNGQRPPENIRRILIWQKDYLSGRDHGLILLEALK